MFVCLGATLLLWVTGFSMSIITAVTCTVVILGENW